MPFFDSNYWTIQIILGSYIFIGISILFLKVGREGLDELVGAIASEERGIARSILGILHLCAIVLLRVILWPLVLIFVLDSNYFFGDIIRDNKRKWRTYKYRRLFLNPPPCASRISFRSAASWPTEQYGVFEFDTREAEMILLARVRKDPHLESNDEGAILNWFSQMDESIKKSTQVPQEWWRFDYLANTLARRPTCRVTCLECDNQYEGSELIIDDDEGKRGWNFYRVLCPQRHPLLAIPGIHLNMG
jgi:hypothetical protein